MTCVQGLSGVEGHEEKCVLVVLKLLSDACEVLVVLFKGTGDFLVGRGG